MSYPPAIIRIVRAWRWWRFRLTQSHRHRALVLERVGDLSLVVLPDVFNPALFPTGAFLTSQLDLTPGVRVLELGTGSGVVALTAARQGADVTATDLNPAAVRCASINALLNDLPLGVLHGDLFAPVAGERFDVVLFNPPFFIGSPQDDYDRAWRATDVLDRFAAQLAGHLTPDGYALVVLSSDGDLPGFRALCEVNQLAVETVAERDLVSERLVVWRLASP